MDWTDVTRRQGGAISRRQLLALGHSGTDVDTLVRGRRLEPSVYRAIYRTMGAPHTSDGQVWTAVLASRAVLSHLSAAQWWELPVEGDGRVHVIRPQRRSLAGHPGLRIHRTLLAPDAVTAAFGLPVTTKRETLLDCLGWLPVQPARTLLDRAFQQHWLTRPDLQHRLDEQAGRWGNKQLHRLLDDSSPGAEAESERRLHRLLLLRRAGVTGWRANVPVVVGGEKYRLDLAFEEAGLAVEVDGWAFHRSKDRRDRDMRKANALMSIGWQLLTFGWEDVVDRSDYVLDSIASVLLARQHPCWPASKTGTG